MKEKATNPDKGRMNDWIVKQKKKGGRRITINLTPEANKALNKLLEDKVFTSATEALNELLIRINKI